MSTKSNAATSSPPTDYDSLSTDEAVVSVLDHVCANMEQSTLFFDTQGKIVARNSLAARTLKINLKQFNALETIGELVQILAKRGDYGDVKIAAEIKRRENRLLVPISRRSFFVTSLKTLDLDIRVRLAPVYRNWRMMTLHPQTIDDGSANNAKNTADQRQAKTPKAIAPEVTALLDEDEDKLQLHKAHTFNDKLSYTMKHASVLESSFAVLSIDFPEFEECATVSGEDVVFFVFMTQAEILRKVTRDVDTLFNVENRQFLAIVECENEDILRTIANRIIKYCSEPVALHPHDDSRKRAFTVNIGAVFFPDSVADLEEENRLEFTRKRAEMAADTARKKGSKEMVIFDVEDVS